MQRKEQLEVGEVYHVMNKSIAGYKIFHSPQDYTRALQMMRYFSFAGPLPKFSHFLSLKHVKAIGFEAAFEEMVGEKDRSVQIIAYCFMPTHIHVIAKQLKDEGISSWMGNTLNAYARYFNLKHKRKGPLWVGKFKNVLVSSDEQLIHLTRYLHLNPVTAHLLEKSEDWLFSSYQEYISPKSVRYPLCQYDELLDIKPKEYQSFANDHASYQREYAKIKKLALE